MNLLSPIKSLAQFGYDAVASTTRRKRRAIDLRSADQMLPDSKRRQLISNTRDLQRNFAAAAWMIRRHLDFVASFTFQCRTGDHVLDKEIEQFINWWSRPANFDVSGRFGMKKMTRLLEGRRTVDGDVGLMKLSNGKVQLIQSDRIRTPRGDLPGGLKPEDFVHGIQATPSGRPRRYAVCNRNRQGVYELKSLIPARHMHLLGYFDEYDQIRGVSPITSAINAYQDTAESIELALAKAKVTQFFALKLTRDADEAPAEVEGEGEHGDKPPYKFNFGEGPQVLDLEPGDNADFLSVDSPGPAFADFLQQVLGIGLKSLDIPYSFYDESFTNYSGARQALLIYERSTEDKRDDLRQLLTQLTAWRLGLGIEDSDLSLPRGMRVTDLPLTWLATGLPWIAPDKEARADISLVEAGLRSRTEICKARGKDFFSLVDELSEEAAYMRSKGLDPAAASKVIAAGPVDDDDEDEQPRRGGQSDAA